MTDYVIITGDNCPYCDKAKALITERGQTYAEINLMDVPELSAVMQAVGQKTVPLVLRVIGGSDKLEASHEQD